MGRSSPDFWTLFFKNRKSWRLRYSDSDGQGGVYVASWLVLNLLGLVNLVAVAGIYDGLSAMAALVRFLDGYFVAVFLLMMGVRMAAKCAGGADWTPFREWLVPGFLLIALGAFNSLLLQSDIFMILGVSVALGAVSARLPISLLGTLTVALLGLHFFAEVPDADRIQQMVAGVPGVEEIFALAVPLAYWYPPLPWVGFFAAGIFAARAGMLASNRCGPLFATGAILLGASRLVATLTSDQTAEIAGAFAVPLAGYGPVTTDIDFLLASLGFSAVILAGCVKLTQLFGRRALFRLCAWAGRHVLLLYLGHVWLLLGGVYLASGITGQHEAFLTPGKVAILSFAFMGGSLLLALLAAVDRRQDNPVPDTVAKSSLTSGG